jgi:hypothetical protein
MPTLMRGKVQSFSRSQTLFGNAYFDAGQSTIFLVPKLCLGMPTLMRGKVQSFIAGIEPASDENTRYFSNNKLVDLK